MCNSELVKQMERLRDGFPILNQTIHGKPLVYLDNAATTQKPQPVIDAIVQYYTEDNANIHRGVHQLSERATKHYEDARVKVQTFLHAASSNEIIFTRGTTEGINLVAQAWGRANLKSGDEVLISGMEHHSNIVPWQMICEERGAILVVVPLTDDGEMDDEAFTKLLNSKTRIVSMVHVSNSLGTVNPVKSIVERAHAAGALVLLDGAQAVAHAPINVVDLDCDFYALSGHKLFGPTGIGVLYGKADVLDLMPPWQGGGDMIRSVTFKKTAYNRTPYRFEAGTPHIEGAIGLGAAIDYVESVGLDKIEEYEQGLLEYGTSLLSDIKEVRIIGTARHKAAILSFLVDSIHPHDLGTILDREGVAIRTGHHCTQPVMERFGIPATARASLALYNTKADLDSLAGAIHKSMEVFA